MSDPIHEPPREAIPLGYEIPDMSRSRPTTLVRAMAIASGTIIALLVAVVIVLPSLNRPYTQAPKTKCAANLKNIGLGVITYANNNNGRFPDGIDELMRVEEMSPSIFICPDSRDTVSPGPTLTEQASHLCEGGHCSYIYVGKGLTASVQNPADVVVAYEPLQNHGDASNFLFADGHVQIILAQQANALIAAIPATRPTPSSTTAP